MEDKNKQPLSIESIAQLKKLCKGRSTKDVGIEFGVSVHTLPRAMAGMELVRGTRMLIETRLKELAAKEEVAP